jgi:hypothetical protein
VRIFSLFSNIYFIKVYYIMDSSPELSSRDEPSRAVNSVIDETYNLQWSDDKKRYEINKTPKLMRRNARSGMDAINAAPKDKKIKVSLYDERDGPEVTTDATGTRLVNGAELLEVDGNQYYYDPTRPVAGGARRTRKSRRTRRKQSKSRRKQFRKGKRSSKRSARRTR